MYTQKTHTKMKTRCKITFLRSPGVQTIPKNAEKLNLSDGIDHISTNTKKTYKNENKTYFKAHV